MSNSGTRSVRIVVDASLAVRAVLPPRPGEADALAAFVDWHHQGISLLSPDLLFIEATSAVRRAVASEAISADAGQTAVADLFALGIESVPTERDLCRRALALAAELGQVRAYDALYLAVAERRETVCFSLDERLVDRARQVGLGGLIRLPSDEDD